MWLFSDLQFDFRSSHLTAIFANILTGFRIYWHSSKYDQVSDLEQQLGAWSGLLISLLEKFNLFHLTSQMKQGVIDVKMNKSNFDEKSSYDVRVAFLL